MLSQQLHSLLHSTGRTLSTAESCTGGAIAAAIVATSGSSDYFKGGIVSYCNEIKERLLGVHPETIARHNVVSAAVATEMAAGAMRVLHTDYAIAVTGCAGPTGGTPEKPVGTIWIAYGSTTDIRTHRLDTDHGRTQNLRNAVDTALEKLIAFLREEQDKAGQ